MGLRGKGARALKQPEPAGNDGAPVARPWENRRTSRPERVFAFIESLWVTSGKFAGTRMRLRTWQRQRIIRPIYTVDPWTDRRRTRTALITMGRKNGKTGLAAALAMTHLCGPEAEPRGQVVSAAATREQAGLIFNELSAMVAAEPWIRQRINVLSFNKRMVDMVTGTTFQSIASDAKAVHGLNPSVIIADELAQWSGRALWEALSTSQGAREQPLLVVISTKSPDPHSVMSELTHYAEQVRDGVILDPSFLPVIYAADPAADWTAEATWRAANPALGDFRSLEEMKVACEQAKRLPAREGAFRGLYLNDPQSSEQRFISAADWDLCGSKVESHMLRGATCYGGLDLSSTKDLTALVLFFPDSGAVLSWFWVPSDNLDEREESDRVPYRTWAKAGLIEATPGKAIDRLAIVRRLAEITAAYDLRGVAYDRWRSEDLLKLLSDEGIDLPVTPWGQGFASMSPAVDRLETLVLNRQLHHGGHPVLTWNCSNTVVELDAAGNRKPSKHKSAERIDGMVALTMAIGLWAKEPGEIQSAELMVVGL